LPVSRQSLFFSATTQKDVERLIARHSDNPVRIAVGDSKMIIPDQVDLHVYEVENHVKLGLLRHMLSQDTGSFLVFARTKHATDRLAWNLESANCVKTMPFARFPPHRLRPTRYIWKSFGLPITWSLPFSGIGWRNPGRA
jgi:superfamily II DNA/RNA helicase